MIAHADILVRPNHTAMTPHDFEAVLRPTLADRRIPGSERDRIKAALASSQFDGAALRARAFEMASAMLESPESREVLAWLESVTKLLQPPPTAAGSGAEAHFSPHGDCSGRIVRLFAEARTHVDVCVFTVTDDRIADAMLAAHARGVVLRVITDNDKASDLGSDIGRLAEAGISLRIDRTAFHMHHKFAIFDGRRLLNGSYNWTRGASRDNQEDIVVTSDAGLIHAFSAEFERLWRELGD